MRKIRYLTLLIFGFSLLSPAQPVLNALDFPTTYSALIYAPPTNGFTNGAAGVNQVWDYSAISLPTTTNLSYTLVPIETTSWAGIFPDANYCFLSLNNNNGVFDYHYWDFYKLTPESFELVGYVDEDAINFFNNSSIRFQFPYTFNSVFTTQHEITPTASVTRTYDGSGTLITPYGTFTNVIRQKSVGPWRTIYSWYSTSPFALLASGNFDENFIYFYKNTTLRLAENEMKSFVIFPNPTTGDITIENLQGLDAKVVVYDMLGNEIAANENLMNIENVSLKAFASGIYFVKITSKDHRLLQTEKIIKQ